MNTSTPITNPAPEVRTRDGLGLHGHLWRTREDPVRGCVVIVHGFGEHGGRYAHVAHALAATGWSVVAWDQRGHGLSPGRRGVIGSFDLLVDDVARQVEAAQVVVPGTGAPVVLGHSMGGLVVLRALQSGRMRARGVILSAPWLGEVRTVTGWQRRMRALLERFAPDLPVPAPLDPDALMRDPEGIRTRARDRLVHERASAGLLAEVDAARAEARARSVPAEVPVLLLVPGDDRLLDQGATLDWAAGLEAPALEVDVLEDRRHEPFNDLGREAVIARVAGWLSGLVTGS